MSEAPLGQNLFLQSFNDPDQVAKYTEGPRRFAPGLDALHTMTGAVAGGIRGEHCRLRLF
jgi:tRNA (cmo5U34)-methyltransferase